MAIEAQPILTTEDAQIAKEIDLESWITDNELKGWTPIKGESITDQPVPLTTAQKRELMIKEVALQVRKESETFKHNMTDGLRIEHAARRGAQLILERTNQSATKQGEQ